MTANVFLTRGCAMERLIARMVLMKLAANPAKKGRCFSVITANVSRYLMDYGLCDGLLGLLLDRKVVNTVFPLISTRVINEMEKVTFLPSN